MPLDTETLFVECDPTAASSLAAEIERLDSGTARVTERRNLDGLATASAALAATVAARLLPQVLNFVLELAKARRVHFIKVGDIEVRNPGEKELSLLRRQIERRIGERR